MALNQNQNRDISNNLIESLRLNPAFDAIPSQIVPTIQPTIESDKPTINFTRVVTSAGTVYTTPSNKDFFLTNINLTAGEPSAGAAGSISLAFITPDGITNTVYLSIHPDATNNDSGNMAIQFPHKGIKLQRNSTITASGVLTLNTWFIAGYISDSTPMQ